MSSMLKLARRGFGLWSSYLVSHRDGLHSNAVENTTGDMKREKTKLGYVAGEQDFPQKTSKQGEIS